MARAGTNITKSRKIPRNLRRFYQSTTFLAMSAYVKSNYVEATAVPMDAFVQAVNVDGYCADERFRVRTINQTSTRNYLASQRWTKGLQDSFITGLEKTPFRYFIIDDSGSMGASDGSILVEDRSTMVNCSRWGELTESMRFHVIAARESGAYTQFRLLNIGDPLTITGANQTEDDKVSSTLMSLFSNSPNGGTPLCHHIRAVTQEVEMIKASGVLLPGMKVAVVIATDGESSDGDVAEALQPLSRLPVNLVIRLCTNEQRIVDYWNSIDQKLEISIDVLDDLKGEGEEVQSKNPFINYCLPLHRFRESGFNIKEFDLLDEDRLAPEQMAKLLRCILGGDIPNMPQLDWQGFQRVVSPLVESSPDYYNPVSRGKKKIVSMSTIKRLYMPNKGCILM